MSRIVELAPTVTLDDVIATKGAGYKPDFKIHTAGIESDRSNSRLVHMIGSSTEQDMQGDVMTLYALSDMTKATPNMTIWLNHNYDLPGSIFGSVVGAPVIKQQQGVADLHLTVDVELDNPAAAQVKRYIDNGRRLGCSIGCMVTKYEVPTEDDGPDWHKQPIKILGVYPVEYSVVGIPCNQRSWVENAISGVFTRTLDPSLAPAMKSLWPSRYKELAKSFSEDTRAQMDRYEPRAAMDGRVEWLPAKKMFLMSYEGQGKEITVKDLKDFLSGAQPIRAQEEVDDLFDLELLKIDDLSEDELDLLKGVCGKTSWPLDMESSWDKTTAHHHLLDWAGGKENFQASKFKSTHFWFDNDGTQISDFHYPFCDVKSGKVVAVWHAIEAAAAALGGARGGTDAGGKGAIRSRLTPYYHKAGKTPPWEKGSEKDDKALDELELTEKEQAEQDLDKVAAAPASDKKPGKGDKGDDHDEDEDADADKGDSQDGDKKPSDNKNDDQDGDKEDDEDGNKKQDKNKKSAEEVVQSSELDPGKLAMLSAYNTVGKSLNLPEMTPEKYIEIQKAGVQVDGMHLHHLQMLHDMVCSMSGGATCANSPAQSFSTAVQQAQEISGNSPSVMPSVAYSLGDSLDKITKSMESYTGVMAMMQKFMEGQGTIKVELEKAQQETAALSAEVVKYQETIAQLKDMPLGNPINHNRTVHPADREATITHEEMLNINKAASTEWQAEGSLEKAFELTTTIRKDAGGMYVQYRVWPEGVGGDTKKGVRPELTPDQITYMSFKHIQDYREGRYAEVPNIGNQVPR